MPARGLQHQPLRIPEQWDANWFRAFVRDVLVNADPRNAVAGPGISIEGNSDQPATLSASEDLQQLLDENYVLAESSSTLANARKLGGEAGVIALTDAGPGGALTIGIEPHGIRDAQLREAIALSVVGNAANAAGEVADIVASADKAVLHRDGTDLVFSPVDHTYLSDAGILLSAGAAWVDSSGGAVATPTNDVPRVIPIDCTLTDVKILTRGGPGSCSIDIWKLPFGSYPPTVANSITGGSPPAISSGNTFEDSTLTGWTTDISAGDVLLFHLNSSGTFTFIAIQLRFA